MVTGRLADEIDGIRRALGSSEIERIAPHCTLGPPVNVREADLLSAAALLRSAAAQARPLAVTLGPPATFFPPNPVCYLTVGGDLDGLSSLRRELQAAPLEPPAGRKDRPFVPHVTLSQKMPPEQISPALDLLARFEASHCFQAVTLIEFDQEVRRWGVLTEACLGPPRIAGRGGLELELSVSGHLDPGTRVWLARQWAQYVQERYGTRVEEDEDFAVTARVRRDQVVAGVADGQIRPPVCHVAHLLVAAEWRSYGIGSQLLRAVDSVATRHHCDRTRLEALAGGMAEGFYRDRGYAVVARLPRWRRERDFVMMERAVTGDPSQDTG
jgi:2'-5' RNA ligase/GNAT superfamily N-acetyltransferase